MKKLAHILAGLAGGKILSPFLLVSFLTFLAKLAIVGKELVVAFRFGRQDELDAFLIALLIPSFIVSILGNAMSSAFIPVFIRVRENEGKQAAGSLFAAMSLLTLCAMAIVTTLIFFLIPWYLPRIASGFGLAKYSLTSHLIVIMIPFLVLGGISSLWNAILNAQEDFALVVLSPMLSPLLMVALLLVLPGAGVYALAYAIPLGCLLEMGVTGAALYKRGFSLWPRPGGPDVYKYVKEATAQFLPAVTGGLLMTSSILVDQAMAAMLPPGSVAALSYGNKSIGFILSILATTIATVLTPYFSKAFAGRNGEDLYKGLRRWIIPVFFASFLIPILLSTFNEPLVKILFYRGVFTLADVNQVAGVQSFLVWQIPFYISAIILVRFIASMRLNWILAIVSACNLGVNIFLNFILMKRMGVNGIALSTTLVHVGSLGLLVFFVYFSSKRAVWQTGPPD